MSTEFYGDSVIVRPYSEDALRPPIDDLFFPATFLENTIFKDIDFTAKQKFAKVTLLTFLGLQYYYIPSNDFKHAFTNI